jgi:hypothetical protein
VEAKLSNQSEDTIRAAVADCLAQCYRGGTPLGVLAEFVAKVRDEGWADPEVRQVESSVRKVLAGVMSNNPGSQSP